MDKNLIFVILDFVYGRMVKSFFGKNVTIENILL